MSGAKGQTFSPLVAGGMVVVGVVCFAAFVVVLALARGPGARDGGAHVLSRSAVGFAGIAELLPGTGTPVIVSRSAKLAESPAAGVLVLTPPPGNPPPEDVGGIVPADVALVVLPKWNTTSFDEHAGWVRAAGLLSGATVLRALPKGVTGRVVRREGTGVPALRVTSPLPAGFRTAAIDRLQVLEGTELRPLLRDAKGGVLLGTDDESLYVLSDPDLLNNLGLATVEGAEAAATLLHALARNGATDRASVAFDLSLNGYGRAHDPLRALFQPPLLGATLCAGMAALLVGLLSAVRFGPAAPVARAFDLGKAALAANSAALITRAGREARMALPYAALVRGAAARALRLPRTADTDARLAEVARQRAPGAEALPALMAAAAGVQDRAGLVAVARRLHAWKESMRADR